MADKTIVNYDVLQNFSNQFDSDAESWADMNSRTLQMVHELESQWIGEGADSFFEEFQNVLLPALKRLHYALLFTSETLRDVMKIFDEAENESANNFNEGSLSDSDFGAGAFGDILDGLGGRTGPGDLRDLDFGLDGIGTGSSGSGATGGGASSDGGTDTGAGAGSGEGGSSGTGAEGSAAGAGSTGGGGGGSGSAGQGIQGDLKMGTGSSSQQSGSGSSGGAGGAQGAMPDHVYQSSSSGGGGASSSPPSQSQSSTPVGGEAEGSGVGGMVGAAGALGGAGAAAGAAKKALQGDEDEDE